MITQSHRFPLAPPHPKTLLSALLIVLAFPPWNCWPLILLALVPWLQVLHASPSRKQALMQAGWLSYGMSWGGFYWVISAVHEYGHLPWVLSVLVFQIFAFGNQLQFYAFAALFHPTSPRPQARTLLFPPFSFAAILSPKPMSPLSSRLQYLQLLGYSASYVTLDWMLPKLFQDTLGHAFFKTTHLKQIADLGGTSLLTFLALLVNLSLWILSEQFRLLPTPLSPAAKKALPAHLLPFWLPFWRFLTAQALRLRLLVQTAAPAQRSFITFHLLLILLSAGYGFLRLRTLETPLPSDRSFQASIIQANIGDLLKSAASLGLKQAFAEVVTQLLAQTRQAATQNPRPQLLIWPETSFPLSFGHPHFAWDLDFQRKMEQLTQELAIPLLFGSYDEADDQDFNGLFLLTNANTRKTDGAATSSQQDLQVYHKSILLLFGESMPGAQTFPFIKKAFPEVGNFGRGPGMQLLKLPLVLDHAPLTEISIAPTICYEGLFTSYVLTGARQGAQVIVNITNDSWFGPWGEPWLHLALTSFRSIETRLPLIRATNTGISALISSSGEILQQSQLNQVETLPITVKLPELVPQTLLKLWGNWFPPACALFVLLSLAL